MRMLLSPYPLGIQVVKRGVGAAPRGPKEGLGFRVLGFRVLGFRGLGF